MAEHTIPASAAAMSEALIAELIEDIQLRRLAGDIALRSRAEIAELARINPDLLREWVQAFQARRSRALSEARSWDLALEVIRRGTLSTCAAAAE
jgi:transposase-like protein